MLFPCLTRVKSRLSTAFLLGGLQPDRHGDNPSESSCIDTNRLCAGQHPQTSAVCYKVVLRPMLAGTPNCTVPSPSLAECMLCSSFQQPSQGTRRPRPGAVWTKLLPILGRVLKRAAGQLQSKVQGRTTCKEISKTSLSINNWLRLLCCVLGLRHDHTACSTSHGRCNQSLL